MTDISRRGVIGGAGLATLAAATSAGAATTARLKARQPTIFATGGGFFPQGFNGRVSAAA